MQRIKAFINDKLKVESRIQQLKGLPKNTIFQSAVTALVSMALLSWFHIRPLGLLFLVIFGFWLYKTRLNIRIQTPPELQKHLQQIQQRLVEWRQTRPTMFAAIASGTLGALAIVGHLVTGSIFVMASLVIAAVISTKYNLKIIKIEPRELFDWAEKMHPDVELDDEFLLEANETNMSVLERASDLASLTLPTEDAENDEDKSDEVPSELLIPDSIPEIDENSTDEEQDDLLPVVKASKAEAQIQEKAIAKVKSSQSGDGIEFKKGHFKRDSSLSTTSSSSEESLSKGLQFPDHTAVDGARSKSSQPAAHNQEATDLVAMVVKAQTQNILANSSKLIPSLMQGLVQNVLGSSGAAGPMVVTNTRRVVTALDSSDESDFEILEDEDFK